MDANPITYLIDPDSTERTLVEGQLEDSKLEYLACGDVDSFYSRIEARRPGCVLTELRLGGTTALHLVARLRQMRSALPVVLLTSSATVPSTVQAFKAGIFDVLEKPAESFRLWECITRAFEVHGRALAESEQRTQVKRRLSQLSSQELQVMRMLLNGEPNKRIAAQLRVSPRTIVFRRKSLMQKMNAKSVGELALAIHLLKADAPESNGSLSLLDMHVAAHVTTAATDCSPYYQPVSAAGRKA